MRSAFDPLALLAGLAFALMWSSAFTSARIIVAEAPPLLTLALRFLISGLLGIALARALGQHWRLTRAQWAAVALFGICQNALYLGLNFVAMQTIEASLAAIVASAMPLLVALALWLGLGERTSALGTMGLIAGLGGVVLIMGTRLTSGVDPLGLALCAMAVLSLTVATLAMRSASSGGNLLMIVGLQMLVGAAVVAVPGALFEAWEVTWSARLIMAFIYTTLVPGLLATLTWFWLVERIGATKAATFHFLNPLFGAGTAALLLSERLGPWDVLGVVVTTVGILAVQLSRRRQA